VLEAEQRREGIMAATINGAAVGIISNTSNARKGRVGVQFPWLATDASVQARLCVPFGNPVNYPQVSDQVLVLFEFGDINRPVVIGKMIF
jgi:uncharacterized protein involved in type VI secretion and phage assembly